MPNDELHRIREAALLHVRIRNVESIGVKSAIKLARKYPTIDILVAALKDGSFCFEGFGPGKIEKLKKSFEMDA